jgi:hypothetical protein
MFKSEADCMFLANGEYLCRKRSESFMNIDLDNIAAVLYESCTDKDMNKDINIVAILYPGVYGPMDKKIKHVRDQSFGIIRGIRVIPGHRVIIRDAETQQNTVEYSIATDSDMRTLAVCLPENLQLHPSKLIIKITADNSKESNKGQVMINEQVMMINGQEPINKTTITKTSADDMTGILRWPKCTGVRQEPSDKQWFKEGTYTLREIDAPALLVGLNTGVIIRNDQGSIVKEFEAMPFLRIVCIPKELAKLSSPDKAEVEVTASKPEPKYTRRVAVMTNKLGDATSIAWLEVGEHDRPKLEQMGVKNDSIKMLYVPEGLKVTVYRNTQFRGEQKTFYGETNNNNLIPLGNVMMKNNKTTWENQISSIKVAKAV